MRLGCTATDSELLSNTWQHMVIPRLHERREYQVHPYFVHVLYMYAESCALEIRVPILSLHLYSNTDLYTITY